MSNQKENCMNKTAIIYKKSEWYFRKYNRKLKMFKGITKEEFEAAKERHFVHCMNAVCTDLYQTEYQRRREVIRYFSTIPYKYDGDYMDDYNHYQRPCSNGIGYVSVCPGEPGNNFYTDDPITVNYLKKKYTKNMSLN